MVVPREDVVTITDMQLEAYSRAREPKELQMLPGGHFSMWEGEIFEEMVSRQVEFLKKTLV